LSPQWLPVRRNVRDRPFEREPVESDLDHERERVDVPASDQAQENYENNRSQVPPQNGERLTFKGEIGPPRNMRAGDDPFAVHDKDPRQRDNQPSANEEHQRAPNELPNSEI